MLRNELIRLGQEATQKMEVRLQHSGPAISTVAQPLVAVYTNNWPVAHPRWWGGGICGFVVARASPAPGFAALCAPLGFRADPRLPASHC